MAPEALRKQRMEPMITVQKTLNQNADSGAQPLTAFAELVLQMVLIRGSIHAALRIHHRDLLEFRRHPSLFTSPLVHPAIPLLTPAHRKSSGLSSSVTPF